jgi:hypothetical protein
MIKVQEVRSWLSATNTFAAIAFDDLLFKIFSPDCS